MLEALFRHQISWHSKPLAKTCSRLSSIKEHGRALWHSISNSNSSSHQNSIWTYIWKDAYIYSSITHSILNSSIRSVQVYKKKLVWSLLGLLEQRGPGLHGCSCSPCRLQWRLLAVQRLLTCWNEPWNPSEQFWIFNATLLTSTERIVEDVYHSQLWHAGPHTNALWHTTGSVIFVVNSKHRKTTFEMQYMTLTRHKTLYTDFTFVNIRSAEQSIRQPAVEPFMDSNFI